ncbi:hypothetical protein PSQ39_17430 [Curvibacter sp. HBC28]|uniref:Sel1 repeat family protein n=1 Tax=Curvibacter microcysteis TaxID=3026419 RepID=A0ABT5MIM0_9BURK|nr:hypothetical protein [Curvibacter sp. HBC28]MDD0816425.1 hypothetical protein [Curvibacter sp. HBC28]
MTIKQLAFAARQALQSQSGLALKLSHVYELMASAYEFKTYASFCANHVFARVGRDQTPSTEAIGARSLDLGYAPENALSIAALLPQYLRDQNISVVRISELVAAIYEDSPETDDDEEEDTYSAHSTYDGPELWREDALLMSGLKAAAERGSAEAHFGLALLLNPESFDDEESDQSGWYWAQQESEGRTLSAVEKEWAQSYRITRDRRTAFEHHLRSAGALGHSRALLLMAEHFEDTTFYETSQDLSRVSHSLHAARVAENLDRHDDAKAWWTRAAEHGNTEAMRHLIECYDTRDLTRCWTWLYLAQLLGTDLTKDHHEAIDESGNPYDDDVGGAAYVGGFEGVQLGEIPAAQHTKAHEHANALYAAIQAHRNERLTAKD